MYQLGFIFLENRLQVETHVEGHLCLAVEPKNLILALVEYQIGEVNVDPVQRPVQRAVLALFEPLEFNLEFSLPFLVSVAKQRSSALESLRSLHYLLVLALLALLRIHKQYQFADQICGRNFLLALFVRTDVISSDAS